MQQNYRNLPQIGAIYRKSSTNELFIFPIRETHAAVNSSRE
jgi:hypothetical protein